MAAPMSMAMMIQPSPWVFSENTVTNKAPPSRLRRNNSPCLAVSCLDSPASEKMNSIAATMYAAVTSPEDMVILQLFVKVNVFGN